MSTQPVAIFGLVVPAGDEPTPVLSEIPGVNTIRITMAAIDPSAKPLEADQPIRATLKVMRRTLDYNDYMDDEDEAEDEESEEESDEEEASSKKSKKKAAEKVIKKALKEAQTNAESMDVDKDGSGDEDDDDEDFEIEEFVICTLDPKQHYQQTLDFTITEMEEVFFKVVGNFDVSLTGNYIVPTDGGHGHAHDDGYDSEDDSDDDDYDLSPDEGELDMFNYGADSDESDELDDIEKPRITEVDSEDEKPKAAKAKEEKKSLKRVAEYEKPSETPEKKLSKKQLKKLKANDGKSIDTTADTPDSKKKVQFAEKLEQGPTGSAQKPKEDKEQKAKDNKASTRIVDGVTIEDKKVGTGAAAKNGSRLGMRYIGKLTNGKTFDSNTKGKPFVFRLGKGEVIKGWDIGLQGMQVGGERRITIPANLAYGKKGTPGIPANSTLTFDVKLIEVK